MIALHLDAGHDRNGNPRRCFLVLGPDGSTVAVVDEGYRGRGALRAWAAEHGVDVPTDAGMIATTPGEYRALLKAFAR